MHIYSKDLEIPLAGFSKCKSKQPCGCKKVKNNTVRVCGIDGWWGDSKKFASDKEEDSMGYILSFESLDGTPLRDTHSQLVYARNLKDYPKVLEFAKKAYNKALYAVEDAFREYLKFSAEKGKKMRNKVDDFTGKKFKDFELDNCLVSKKGENSSTWRICDIGARVALKQRLTFDDLIAKNPNANQEDDDEEEDFFDDDDKDNEDSGSDEETQKNGDYVEITLDTLEESMNMGNKDPSPITHGESSNQSDAPGKFSHFLTKKSPVPAAPKENPLDKEDPGQFYRFLQKSPGVSTPTPAATTPRTPSYNSPSNAKSTHREYEENVTNELDENDDSEEEITEPTQPVSERSRSRSPNLKSSRSRSTSPENARKSTPKETSKSPARSPKKTPESLAKSPKKTPESPAKSPKKIPESPAKSPKEKITGVAAPLSLLMGDEEPSVTKKRKSTKSGGKNSSVADKNKPATSRTRGAPKLIENVGTKGYEIYDNPDRLGKPSKRAKTTV